jgi:23S rRNA pseudouridine1911/1915/1917 synthase
MLSFPDSPRDPYIVFENDTVLVVFKPNKLHTVPGDNKGSSLLAWVHDLRPAIACVHGREKGEGGLVHRLDYETSGLVLFAKSDEAFLSIEQSASIGSFFKHYYLCAQISPCGVAGALPVFTSPRGVESHAWEVAIQSGNVATVIDLLRAALRTVTSAVVSNVYITSVFRGYGPHGARTACANTVLAKTSKKDWGETEYQTYLVNAEKSSENVMAEIVLVRGFRHQIRAHMAWIGLPLNGDVVYGGSADERLRLHAQSLRFPDPEGRGTLVIEYPDVNMMLDADGLL